MTPNVERHTKRVPWACLRGLCQIHSRFAKRPEQSLAGRRAEQPPGCDRAIRNFIFVNVNVVNKGCVSP
jgi:hypothetical protein